MCSLRDAATELGALGVDVHGISRDGVAALAKFAKEQKLDFPLLSDPDGSATGKYEADSEGRPLAQRVTFVIDEQGVIRVRDESVDVASHGSDLVERIRELRQEPR